METINSLPTIENSGSPLYGKLEPKFWRYYEPPFDKNFLYDPKDPYNDLVSIFWGPRGGGKSTTGVAFNILDGQMRGIPVISNVPIVWIAKDINGKEYKVESLLFNVDQFESGDPILKYKRLLLDEGNYLADRLRSTSNNNLAITDILQQARKFRMCVTFCSINWQWIDPRVTGSLCDLIIECNDLYYKPYGKKHGLKKGERITWDPLDQSGKLTGRQNSKMQGRTFNSRLFWNTFNTEQFVNPREARQKRNPYAKIRTYPGPDGEPMEEAEWYNSIKHRVIALGKSQGEWKAKELFDSLGIEELGLRQKAGSYLRNVLDARTRATMGRLIYNLSDLDETPE